MKSIVYRLCLDKGASGYYGVLKTDHYMDYSSVDGKMSVSGAFDPVTLRRLTVTLQDVPSEYADRIKRNHFVFDWNDELKAKVARLLSFMYEGNRYEVFCIDYTK